MNTPSTSAGILDLDSPNPNRERGARGDRSGIASSIFSSFRASKQRNQAPVGEELKVEDQLRGKMVSEDYIRQTGRRWTLGDVYAPHDLSGVEQKKWKAMSNIQKDLVDLLGLKPLDMYRVRKFFIFYFDTWMRSHWDSIPMCLRDVGKGANLHSLTTKNVTKQGKG